jgi:hypothetical protein
MLKLCLSAAAVVSLYALLGAQVPGSGPTNIACGTSKSIAFPAATATSTGATSEDACATAAGIIGISIINFGISKCARCPGGTPHCGGGEAEILGAPPFLDPQFDPFLGIWTCTATLPAGTVNVSCDVCDS